MHFVLPNTGKRFVRHDIADLGGQVLMHSLSFISPQAAKDFVHLPAIKCIIVSYCRHPLPKSFRLSELLARNS